MGNRPANRFVNSYEKDAEEVRDRYQVLRDLDVFILDNSIRESTVGQLKGHTLESKWEIYNEVKKCGFKNIIVASFSHMTRVDDIFITELVEKGEDRNGLFAFSEVTDSKINLVLFISYSSLSNCYTLYGCKILFRQYLKKSLFLFLFPIHLIVFVFIKKCTAFRQCNDNT